MSINPTVGRIVWFYPSQDDVEEGIDYRDQPLVGQIVYVHNTQLVNLHVLDASGNAWKFEEVLLFQDRFPEGYKGRGAEWMPYQKKQTAFAPMQEGLSGRNPLQPQQN